MLPRRLPERGSSSKPGSHLRIMTMYGFEPAAQHGWVNLGCTAPGQNKSDPTGVITKAEGWQRYGIPSLFDLSPCVLPADGSVGSSLPRL